MKTMKQVATGRQINEDMTYDTVIQRLMEAKENNIPLDEGIIGALTGGLIGATVGPAVMKAVCKILGVDERGQSGSLLTSRMMTTALGATMGWNK